MKTLKKLLLALATAVCLSVPSFAQKPRDLAHAIAYAEGFYVKGSKANRNHNPGNIRRGTKYVHFHTDAEGFAALYELLKRVVTGDSRFYNVNMSLKEFGNVYADGHGIWAKNVAKLLGVQVTTKLWEVLDTYPRVVIPFKLK